MLLGGAAVGIAVWTYRADPTAPGGPNPLLILVSLLVVANYTAVGYLVGRIAPAVIAVPLAALGSFVVMTSPVAMEPVWLRHLTGANYDNCCAVDQVHADEILAGAALFNGSVAISMILVVSLGAWMRILGIVPLAAGVIGAVGFVAPMDWHTGKERSISEADCVGEAPRVCTWPEQHSSAEYIHAQAASVFTRLDVFDVAYAEAIDPLYLWSSSPRPNEVAQVIASELLPREIFDCSSGVPDWQYDAYDTFHAWLLVSAGVDPAELPGVVNDVAVEEAEVVSRTLSREDQAQWYRNSLHVLSDCHVNPPEPFPRPSALISYARAESGE
jgi:hypothetical protein